MKTNFLLRPHLFALIGSTLVSSAMLADVVWPAIKDVTNEDIIILRDSRMPRGNTAINAIVSDIDVSLSQDITIDANDCGPSHLLLNVTWDEGGTRTINFLVTDHDLKFKAESKDDEFSVEKNGGGDAIFSIDNNHELEFKVSHRVEPIVLPAPGTARWHHSTVMDMTDEDVIWDGKIRLPVGFTTISALTQDVSIFISGKEAKFKNSKTAGSTLTLFADFGRTITVYLDRDLEFESDNFFPLDLVLTGQGQVKIVRQP